MATYTKLIRLVLLATLGTVPAYAFGAKCGSTAVVRWSGECQ